MCLSRLQQGSFDCYYDLQLEDSCDEQIFRGYRHNIHKSIPNLLGNNGNRVHLQKQQNQGNAVHFPFFHSYHSPFGPLQAVLGLGECASIIGEGTLKAVQLHLGSQKFGSATIQQNFHPLWKQS